MFDAPALDPFAGRSRRDQAITVLGGVLACLAGYLGGIWLATGSLSVLADGPGSRLAPAGASVACWGYYALAFVRARGGPILNAALYPLLTVGIAPTLLRWLVAGPSRTAAGMFSLSLDPLVTAAFAILPGVGWFGVILAIWASRLDESRRREWERTNLTPEFRAEFLDAEG